MAGAGIYCALATMDEVGLRIAAGIAGGIMGANLAGRLAGAQMGTDTCAQKTGVAVCTVLGAAAGSAISALGSNQLIVSIATCTVLTAGASLVRQTANLPDPEPLADRLKLGAAAFGLMGGLVVGSVDREWKVDSRLLPARNLGLITESSIIELGKSSFERLGPSVDRHALNFEGRVVAALVGMAPYVAATVILNGYVSGKLQPDYDSIYVHDLAAPALVGAIANAVRGATNALAVSLLRRQQRFAAADGRDALRASAGVRCPRPCTVSNKTCVRYFLSACRNAVYARFRDAGFSVIDANMMAQGVYACFAQCRDLIADLIKGEGWSEPRMQARRARPEPPAATAEAIAEDMPEARAETDAGEESIIV